ncbi:MAG TPA: hypothetical protein VI074_00370, partial [Propionibacteriaceae bacterium]
MRPAQRSGNAGVEVADEEGMQGVPGHAHAAHVPVLSGLLHRLLGGWGRPKTKSSAPAASEGGCLRSGGLDGGDLELEG